MRGARVAIFVLGISLVGCAHILALGICLSWFLLRAGGSNQARNPQPTHHEPLQRGSDTGSASLSQFVFGSLHSGRAARVFPYSIIPGGIAGVKELKKVVANDPIVAAHYAGFDLAKARLIRLKKQRSAYVSYRLGEKTYWTTRKLKLNAGEALITDGHYMVRTRCGNLVSDIPALPVSAGEPTPSVLDTPLNFRALIAPSLNMAFVSADKLDESGPEYAALFPVLPLIYGVPSGAPRPFPPPPPTPPPTEDPLPPPGDTTPPPIPDPVPTPNPVPTPEPGTWILLTTGLAGILLRRKPLSSSS